MFLHTIILKKFFFYCYYVDSTDTKIVMFPFKMSSSQFQEVIQLVSDPVLLGNKLLHMAKTSAAEKNDNFEGTYLIIWTAWY